MSDAVELDKCRADLLRSRTACENQKHIIIDLEAKLAATQQRLAELMRAMHQGTAAHLTSESIKLWGEGDDL